MLSSPAEQRATVLANQTDGATKARCEGKGTQGLGKFVAIQKIGAAIHARRGEAAPPGSPSLAQPANEFGPHVCLMDLLAGLAGDDTVGVGREVYEASASSRCITQFEFGDEPFLPHALRTECQAQIARALVVKVAIEFPGEADAAMRLRVFFRGEVEGLRRGDTRGGCGERKFARVRRKRPGAEIGIRARELV